MDLGSGKPSKQRLPLAPRIEQLVHQASDESRGLGQDYVGTEHLLLALFGVENGVAARAFEEMDLMYHEVRHEVIEILGLEPPEEVPSPGDDQETA